MTSGRYTANQPPYYPPPPFCPLGDISVQYVKREIPERINKYLNTNFAKQNVSRWKNNVFKPVLRIRDILARIQILLFSSLKYFF